MKKLLAIAAAVSLNASAQADELSDLLAASQSIVDQFGEGIKVVGGQLDYASVGGISPDMASQYWITTSQMDAYNSALASVQTMTIDAGAQEYFNTQSQQAMQQLEQAVSTYTQAAGAVIEVTALNAMVNEAVQAGDTASAMEIQSYVVENDLTLNQVELDVYNEALSGVETSAQAAASFMAVARSADLVQSANSQAEQQMVDYSSAASVTFDAASASVQVSFANSAATVQLDVMSAYKSSVDIITAGSESMFYETSPVANQCFFATDYEACITQQDIEIAR